MILTCPHCEIRYLVPVTALGAEGRRVKCTACEEIWFQEPEADEFSTVKEQEEQGAFEPIPRAVRPIPEGSSVPALMEEEAPSLPAGAMRNSYLASGGVFIVILLLLFAFQGPITNAWPSTNAVYGFFGRASPSPSLAFDKVEARIEGDSIKIHGNVINLGQAPTTLPRLEAALRSEEGEQLVNWDIVLEQSALEGEATLPFSSNTPLKDMHKPADILLRFSAD